MGTQNAFPAASSTNGYQVISSTCSESDMVRLASGNLVKKIRVVNVPTVSLPLLLTLVYNSQGAVDGSSPVGNKWHHSYMMALTFAGSPVNLVTFIDPTGRHYNFIPSGGGWGPSGTSYYFPGTLSQSGSNWLITYPGGIVHTFNSTGQLISLVDSNGNTTTLGYSGTLLTAVTEPTGRQIQFGYTGSLTTTLTDPNANETSLVYDDASNLTHIIGPEGCVLQYTYDSDSMVLSRTDANGNILRYQHNDDQQLVGVQDAATPASGITYRGLTNANY